jgi:hypothetical protein
MIQQNYRIHFDLTNTVYHVIQNMRGSQYERKMEKERPPSFFFFFLCLTEDLKFGTPHLIRTGFEYAIEAASLNQK